MNISRTQKGSFRIFCTRELRSTEPYPYSSAPNAIAELLNLVVEGKVSEKNAKLAAIKYANEKILPLDFLKKNGLLIDVKQADLQAIVEKVLKENQKAFLEFKAGNKKSLNFLVGIAMRETKGKADARQIQKMIEEKQ